MNAVSLLAEIIAQGGKVSSGFYRGNTFDALVQHGFLRKAGMASSVVCDACELPHSVAVVFKDGGYGYHCTECGFIALDPAEITTFRPDLPDLVHRLAEDLGCERRKSQPLFDQTWRIGAAHSALAPVMLYLHPTLQTEEDARDLQRSLGREARADWRLVVTAQGSLPVAGVAVVRLDDLVEMDLETGALHSVADLGTLAGVPQKRTGGRPSDYGHLLKPLIEERIRTGQACEVINKETRAVLAAFQVKYPEKPTPSESTVKRYIRKPRGGS